MREAGNFVVYKSSAGSGKTYTLVREYLKIVLQNPDLFRNVLAITFTNKAANEMKERVVRYLVALADPAKRANDASVKQLLPQLSEQLGMPEPQVCERAEKVLRLIMHHYGEFSISTIDSFTHRVIRTFAHDLDIPMNFEVELDGDLALTEAIDELISLVGSDKKLTRLLVEFVEKKAGDEMNWQIEKDLYDFGRTLLNEDSIRYVEELRRYDLDTFMEVRGRLYGWKTQFEKKAREIAQKALTLAESIGLDHDAIFQKIKGVLTYIINISKEKSNIYLPNSYAKKSLETGDWLGGKVSPALQAAFASIRNDLVGLGKSLLDLLEEDYPRYVICQLLLNNLYATALLGEIEKILQAACKDDNKVLISEFNRRISAIVREQPAPFIYERLGERYQHYLLDEFQDTSIMQWHNLLPLIENALASNRMNLVVGDAKQAIYRWRSGDARQFEMLPGLIRETPDPLLDSRERMLRENFHQENLAMNHRSSPVIVDFNNRFFRDITPLLPEGHRGLYDAASQVAAKKDKPGLVNIDIIPKDDPSGLPYVQLVLERTAVLIDKLLSEGYHLGDIAILCRKNEKAAAIASFLLQKNISVISSESLLLSQSENVNFFLAWARHLDVKNDPLPLAGILHYLVNHGYFNDSGFDEAWLGSLFPKTVNPGGDLGLAASRFMEILEKRLPDFQYMGLKNLDLQGLFRYLADYFNLDIHADSYLRFFMDYVMDFMKKNHGGIPEFMEWWEDKSSSASLVIPEGLDAVRIMTIHKAKGLQFPVVIFPFADEDFRMTKKNLWVPVEDEMAQPLGVAYLPSRKSIEDTAYAPYYREERELSELDLVNVLYVALTRPEERLYIITKPLPAKPDGAISLPRLFLNFLQAEGIYDPGKLAYQFGESFFKPTSSQEPATAGKEEPSFKGRAALKLMLRKHAPSSWEMDQPEQEREWGTLVHALMSELEDIRQMRPSIDELENMGEVSSKEADKLRRMADAMARLPEVAEIFSPDYQVRNEAEILTPEGNSYRPDRVMIRDNDAIIIDYKTGAYKESHREQVNLYAGLLNAMGYKVVSAGLLYLDETPKLVKII